MSASRSRSRCHAIRRLMVRSRRSVGRGSIWWRIFHPFRMQRYWLVTHPPLTFSSRPSQLSSLSLDMPSKLFHALSRQRRLRITSLALSLSICSPVDSHAWLYPLPYSIVPETCFPSTFHRIAANHCLPSHLLSESLNTLFLNVQRICKSSAGGIVFWWKLIYLCLCCCWHVLGQLNGKEWCGYK